VRFFFDNCVSPRIAEALAVLELDYGNEVVHLRNRWSGRMPDPEWIAALGQEGEWVICTTDLDPKNPDNRRL
jgi:predicted nuclease of predicted toxin-antitoxin system